MAYFARVTSERVKELMSERMKLSIIIPIFKVEAYLRKCVESVLNQDLPSSEYEIILVNDGSPDGCPQICDEYAVAHKNIKVIHRENGGLSAARNSGIEIANGEYIMFVDSDDYLEPNILGYLMRTMEEKQLDVLRYNYQNVRENGEIFVPFKTGKPYFDYSDDVLDGEAFLNERLGYACYAWAFILRRDLIISNDQSPMTNGKCEKDNILFTPDIYFEDTDWTPRMLLRAKRVSSTPLIVYNYLWREGSITLPDNPTKKKKVLEDKISNIEGFKQQQVLVRDKRWFEWQTAGVAMYVLGVLASYRREERKPYFQKLKSLNIFPLSTYRAVGNNKWKIRLANISPILYCNIMHLIHK